VPRGSAPPPGRPEHRPGLGGRCAGRRGPGRGDHIQLVAEITSESTFETDTTTKRVQYAAAGIPGYLVVHFEKDWSKISEIEEYRLDWSGRRYVVQTVHRRALVLD
jgi:Uma2 family endonuclease